MKKQLFKGVATAIVTPFCDGKIDYSALEKLLDFQLNSGIDAIVVAGTTGENATLSDDEHCSLIDFCVRKINGKIPLIASTGSNDTAHAIRLSRRAEKLGADGLLLVSPYYNKASDTGIVKSFTAIANSVSLPCILYNVPSRTGVNVNEKTLSALQKVENIVGIKEASGNVGQAVRILAQTDLRVYSGCDDLTLPILSVGGSGVISVASNVIPLAMKKLCSCFFAGETERAKNIQLSLSAFINLLFCEVNPIPIKAVLSKTGLICNELRLPLTALPEEKEKDLFFEFEKIIKSYGNV